MKTALSTPSGSYQFNRLPYGVSNSPASFERLMDLVLKHLTGSECFVCIDNLILFADTIQEHARRLEHVLQSFDRANVQLEPGKCVFAQPKVEYLVYVVPREGIAASPDKVLAVRQYPVPRKR
jgi:hypothetical protein